MSTTLPSPTLPSPIRSSTLPSPAPVPQGTGRRVFRGASDEELIPRIQAELGADAIVIARRSGLEGGMAGFFQKPYVEIEAEAGRPGIDLYDGEPASPLDDPALSDSEAELMESFRELLPPSFTPPAPLPAAPAPALAPAAPAPPAPAPAEEPSFASMLATAPVASLAQPAPEAAQRAPASAPTTPVVAPTMPVVAPTAPMVAAPPAPGTRPRTRLRTTLEARLLEAGMSEGFAGRLIDGAAAHLVPLDPGAGLAGALREAVQSHIPVRPPLGAAGGTIVLVGPGGSGKTECCRSLVEAYERSGALSADLLTILGSRDRGDLELRVNPGMETPISVSAPRAAQVLAPAAGAGMRIVDTPTLSPGDHEAIGELAAMIERLQAERIVVALPATLGARAARQLLEALAPLGATTVAITHADETDQLGVAVEAACEFGLAPELLVERSGGTVGVRRVSPAEIAERILG